MSDSTNPPPPYRASPRIIMRPPPSRQPPVQHARSLPRFCARTLAAVGHGDRGHKSSARRVTFSSHDASPTTVETRFSQRMGSSTRTIVFVFRPVLKPGIRHATALPLRT
ncbi:hypothetical protein BD309DRAFT_957637 [Dichomitus squalens]|nr:uncharacterized protein DICSQDRAFT_135170 [Dichomitus squalens LYAD-421 SS1]EJF62893.1 hypothetical protein DICSQDRAFT_135170 [Dichomitus squalens LYAD-421 SS1]TBU44783.1 hypothetical protein BD309DRAFT_957637 [Dichomitus squalens]TBU64206.1 hypothetical protein BD310DRAFT_915557 [Dichomitus squalens]